ncbi:MAG TPA: potassium channel protein [Planktothrix sp.]
MNRANFHRFYINILRVWMLIIVGTAGYSLIEHWSPLDSLFFTVITLTTVGYDEVHPLDTAGKVYTIFLILFGVGYVLYVLADMVDLFVKLNLGFRRMQHRIVKLANHQIVCGFGRTGQEVAEQFRRNKIPFVIIEMDPKRVKKAEEEGLLVIQGDASSDDILREAQIHKAAGIVCALPEDTANTFIALSAKGLNENITIVSRAANPGSEAKLRRAGAGMVISPYVICGRRMAAAVTHPLVTEFLEVVMHSPGQDLHMEQVKVATGCALIGTNLKDANIKATSGAMILAVQQNGKLMTNPSPELVFLEGDELIALGTEQQLQSLASMAGTRNN